MDQVQNEYSSINSVINSLYYRHSPKLFKKTEKIATTLYHKFLDRVPAEGSKYATATELLIARMFSLSGHHISRYEIAVGCGLSSEEFDAFLNLIYKMSGLDFCLVVLSILNCKTTPQFSRMILKRFFIAVSISLKFYDYVNKPTTILNILSEPRFRIQIRNKIRSLCRGDLEQAGSSIGDLFLEHWHSDILFILSELYIQQGKLSEAIDVEVDTVKLFMQENGLHSLKI